MKNKIKPAQQSKQELPLNDLTISENYTRQFNELIDSQDFKYAYQKFEDIRRISADLTSQEQEELLLLVPKLVKYFIAQKDLNKASLIIDNIIKDIKFPTSASEIRFYINIAELYLDVNNEEIALDYAAYAYRIASQNDFTQEKVKSMSCLNKIELLHKYNCFSEYRTYQMQAQADQTKADQTKPDQTKADQTKKLEYYISTIQSELEAHKYWISENIYYTHIQSYLNEFCQIIKSHLHVAAQEKPDECKRIYNKVKFLLDQLEEHQQHIAGSNIYRIFDTYITGSIDPELSKTIKRKILFLDDRVTENKNIDSKTMDWKRYHKELQTLRKKYKKQAFSDANIKSSQLSFSSSIRSLIAKMSKNSIGILGDPPFPFMLIAHGSLARNELTPYSDFEFSILIKPDENNQSVEYKKHPYLLNFIKLVSFYFRAFGEPNGLRMESGDMSDLLSGGERIVNTPHELAAKTNPRFTEAGSPEIVSIHRSTLVFCIEGAEILLIEYYNELARHFEFTGFTVNDALKDKDLKPHDGKNTENKNTDELEKGSDIEVDNQSKTLDDQEKEKEKEKENKVALKLDNVHAQYALKSLLIHKEEFNRLVKFWDKQPETHLKERYLMPLKLWCMNLGLFYSHIDYHTGAIERNLGRILQNLLEKGSIYSPFIKSVIQGLYDLEQLRVQNHFRLGYQADKLKYLTEEQCDDRQKAILAKLKKIDRCILQPIYETIDDFIQQPHTENFDPFIVYFHKKVNEYHNKTIIFSNEKLTEIIQAIVETVIDRSEVSIDFCREICLLMPEEWRYRYNRLLVEHYSENVISEHTRTTINNVNIHIPYHNGSREIFNHENACWDKLLDKNIFEPYDPNKLEEYKINHRIIAEYATSDRGHKRVKCVLREGLVDQWLDEYRAFKEVARDIEDGKGIVVPLVIEGETLAYLKIYPELPGVQIAADQLSRRITGYGNLATLCRFTPVNTLASYPVLISKNIGLTFSKLLAQSFNINPILNSLDPTAFTLKVIESIIINYEDDKKDNLALEHFTTLSGNQGYQLVSIDPDHAFVDSVVKKRSEQSRFFQSSEKLKSKTMVFLFDQMLNSLDQMAVDEFLHLNPEALFADYLDELDLLEQIYFGEGGVFDKKEVEKFANDKTQGKTSRFSFLPIVFQIGMFDEVMNRFIRTQTTLKEHSPDHHFSLLEHIQPRLKYYYKTAFDSAETPYERFDNLPTDYKIINIKTFPDKHKIVQHQSTFNLKSRLQYSITIVDEDKKKDMAHAIQTGQLYTPEQVRNNEFIPIVRTLNNLDKITDLLLMLDENGRLNQSAIEFLKSTHLNSLKEHLINRFCFEPDSVHDSLITIQNNDRLQNEILQYANKTPFKRLILRNWSFLSDKVIIPILKQAEDLYELDLTGCHALTEKTIHIISTYCLNIKRLTLNNLPNLKNINLGDKLNQLTTLSVRKCEKLRSIAITSAFLYRIDTSSCENLTKLNVASPNMIFANLQYCISLSNNALAKFVKKCPNMERMNLFNCRNVTQRSIKQKKPWITKELNRFGSHESARIKSMENGALDETLAFMTEEMRSAFDVKSSYLYSLAGLAFFNLRIYEAAKACYRKSVKLNKKNKEAQERLDELNKLFPESVSVFNLFGSGEEEDIFLTLEKYFTRITIKYDTHDPFQDSRLEQPLPDHRARHGEALIEEGYLYEALEYFISKEGVNNTDKDGFSILHDLACDPVNDAIKSMIEYGADINLKGNDGETPLINAIFNQQKDTVEFLLKAGADTEIRFTKDSHTPLTYATQTIKDSNRVNSLDIIGFLLKYGANLYARPKGYVTCFEHACSVNDRDLIELFLPYYDVNKPGFYLNTPLYSANNPEVFELLLKNGANINHKNSYERTVLHFFARADNKEMLTLAIKHGAIVDAEDINGFTPLGVAAFRGYTDLLELLFEHHGANIHHASYFGWTPLHLSVLLNQVEVFKYLLHSAPKLMTCKDKQNHTATDLAISLQHNDIINLDPKTTEDILLKTTTVLHLLITTDHRPLLEHLLVFALLNNVNEKDYDDQTAFQLALHVQDYESAKLLYNHEASVEGTEFVDKSKDEIELILNTYIINANTAYRQAFIHLQSLWRSHQQRKQNNQYYKTFIKEYVEEQNYNPTWFFGDSKHDNTNPVSLSDLIADSKQQIKKDPESSHDHHNLACYYHAQSESLKYLGDHNTADIFLVKANKHFLRALALKTQANTCVEYANFLIMTQQVEMAIPYLHEAIKQNDDGSGLYYTHLEAQTVSSELREEIEKKGRIDIKPVVFAYRLLIHAYLSLKKFELLDEYIISFEKIVETDTSPTSNLLWEHASKELQNNPMTRHLMTRHKLENGDKSDIVRLSLSSHFKDEPLFGPADPGINDEIAFKLFNWFDNETLRIIPQINKNWRALHKKYIYEKIQKKSSRQENPSELDREPSTFKDKSLCLSPSI